MKTVVHLVPAMLLVACASAPAADGATPTSAIEDQAGELISQVKFELHLREVMLLNPYLESDSPKVDAFDAVWTELTQAADAIVAYSTGVLQLDLQGKTDEDVGQLIVLTRELVDDLSALPNVQRNLSIVDLDGVLQDAATQANVTKALRAAAPVTNAVAAALEQTVIDANDLFDPAFEETYDKVVAEQRPLMEYTDTLVERRNGALNGLLMLERARKGDADAWAELLASNRAASQAVSDADQLSQSALDRAESALTGELSKVAELWSYLKPSYEEYQAVLEELYAVENDARKMLKLARLIADNWDKAQRQMAKGKPNAFASVASNLLQLAIKRAARR